MDPDRLKHLFLARHRCVRIVTQEEQDVLRLGVETALALNLDALVWSVTSGVRLGILDGKQKRLDDAANPAAAMQWLVNHLERPTMVILLDMADQLGDSVNLRALRDLVSHIAADRAGQSALLLIDHQENIPPVIGAMSVRHEITAPDDTEINRIVRDTLRSISVQRNVEARVSQQFLQHLVLNLRGLTRRQIRDIITQCVMRDGKLDDGDLATVQESKRKLIEDSGVLEFVDAPASLDDIGGLSRMKHWLRKREATFDDPTLSPPRGVLLLGVQGAGKSLAAKAIATAWKRPLMRLDPGALFNKYVGETERNLRDALRQAEAMAPVVLWIDEIEKGFASAASTSNDGGVSRRMFGTLLTWMQEHRSPVFLVATANDIEALPPELLRKGRFDEIFFVDLPAAPVREVIFAIHLRKRGHDPRGFDVAALAGASEGYSGAEIEQGVISAHIDAKHAKAPLDTQRIVEAVRNSPPLSVTMAEKITDLRAWSEGRCVPAD